MPIQYPDEHFTVKARYRGENASLPGAKETLETLAAYERLMEAERLKADAILVRPEDAHIYPLNQFSKLPKRDALVIAFQTIGNPAKNGDLYRFLKANGHPVASTESLTTILRECPEFESVKWGVWRYLPERRHIPGRGRSSGTRKRQLAATAAKKAAKKAAGAKG